MHWEMVWPIVTLVVGVLMGYAFKSMKDRSTLREAEDVAKNAQREADAVLKEARIAAKEEMLKAKDEFEKSTKERRVELQKFEERLGAKEENVERKSDLIEQRAQDLDRRDKELRRVGEQNTTEAERLSGLIARELSELERIASLNKDEAKKQLLDRLSETLEAERGALIRRFQEENRQRMEREAQEIMVLAMQRYAGDCAYERTTSTIPLPNEEMKGRIIGREGRNIRAIEAATGANILIDDTPEAVVVSCFDPVRREIARVTLERLGSDGRIHPTRIEDMVGKAKSEIEAEILKAGQEAVDRLGLTKVKPNLVRLLGRLKYRYSYSQNVLQHSLEVAYMMGGIAAQLGLDESRARRAGMFHDIGKAVDHEVEGSHAVIGADLLKRAGEDDEICTSVGAHHEEMEKTSLLATLVAICDALSASRPGARSETTELYLKRLEELESVGKGFDGVETCYAIQAGRELRVIVLPEKIDENRAMVMAREMADRIEKEMRYPGQIKVTVIRETRVVEYAK